MLRRVVCLLLLPCMLLTQSAALFGHTHAGLRLPGHDLRPHFHTQPVAASYQNDRAPHHHGHGGHHHNVADGVAPDAPTQHPKPLPDHDSDAIYVNATDAVAVERSELLYGSSVFSMAFASDLFALAWAEPPAHLVICGHPPPLPGHECPLYVKHRALLI